VRADREGNDNVAVNNEKNAVFFSDIKVENLMAMPENACQLVAAQRRMSPIC